MQHEVDAFYRAFEERFRGSRDLIKDRLAVYLPFVELLGATLGPLKTVDLGCGRGEWLELLQSVGVPAVGVDLNAKSVEQGLASGLNVTHGDAIDYLAGLGAESLAIVSAFHVVEHLPFECLQSLVAQAMRVLQPGGLLIMETPNPENLVVGATNFYLDPTHIRPVHPALLSFLPEYVGFERIKVLRLQETYDPAKSEGAGLWDVLSGVSQDYAVIAQKGGNDAVFEAATPLFEKEYGVSLEMLVNQYDRKIADLLLSIESSAGNAELRAQAAELRAQAAEDRAQRSVLKIAESEERLAIAESSAEQLKIELNNIHAANHHHWQLSQSQARQLEELRRSYSWRITAPLRWLGTSFRVFESGVLSAICVSALKRLVPFVVNRPWLRKATMALLACFPGLKSRLFHSVLGVSPLPQKDSGATPVILEENLSASGRQVYKALLSSIDEKKKGNR